MKIDRLAVMYKRLRSHFATAPTKFPAYLKWLRQQPCVRCGRRDGIQPHHVFGSYGSHKTSDLSAIPVCAECHEVLQDKHEAIEYLVITLARKENISNDH